MLNAFSFSFSLLSVDLILVKKIYGTFCTTRRTCTTSQ